MKRGQGAFFNLLWVSMGLFGLMAILPVLTVFIDDLANDANTSTLLQFFIWLIPIALLLGVIFAYLSRADPTRAR